ncbi:hypothetical protein CHARACLAT_024395 [Characodon lateralis]|uniref:Uncharacterized protein n=1 Tax=Characodon lateralis TaxID=208331 RepID=A0ABU7E367_9TELE|nr:hypothetical protein [Characodon lateralis]
MKMRVCQGVGGIIIVTMVTGLMVVYSSSGGRSPSSASTSLYSRHVDAPAPATKRPHSVQASTLGGVAGILDLKEGQVCGVHV